MKVILQYYIIQIPILNAYRHANHLDAQRGCTDTYHVLFWAFGHRKPNLGSYQQPYQDNSGYFYTLTNTNLGIPY